MTERWATGLEKAILTNKAYEYFENICQLCFQEIDRSLPENLPGSPTIDHEIAQSVGGAKRDIENLLPMHNRCNQFKGTKPIEVARALWIAKQAKNTKVW